MPIVRWLHMSDLHLNTPGFGSRFLRDELPGFLKRSGITCDYVFCTGDLRDGRQGVFPSDNGQFLHDICEAIGGRLFIVPGNHDVDRGDETGARQVAVKRILSYYRADEGIIKSEDLMPLYDSQEKFRTYVSALTQMSYNPQQPHFNVETEYFNILHVDSTLTYGINHETNLILGTSLLYDAVKTINPAKPTILLTHYAYTMLAQDEKKLIGEMLYRNGIQLWLAGHEHEHNLQPVKYLHSIQSGELRLEDRSNTSVLIGEFDTDRQAGKIRAYAWFPEGWHLYPAIWHGVGKDDEYPFALRLQGDSGLRSLEAVNSHKNNEKFRKPYALLNELFADIEWNGRTFTEITDCVREAWEKHEHLVLIADGGMGKTTRLLAACETLHDKPAVYLPIESTEDIIRDLCRAVFSESSEERLYQLTKDRHTEPDLYLFLDGMNEISAEREKEVVNVLRKIVRDYPGIQLVVSSRSNFTGRYRLDSFSLVHLKPLREKQIRTLFNDEEWETVKNNPPLKKLVQNPLMATLYKNISPEMGRSEEYITWVKDIRNETELIYDYYMTQIALQMGRDINVVQYIKRCLPYIAFAFEHAAKHTMGIDEFRCVLDEAAAVDLDESVDGIRRALRIKSIPQISGFDLEDYILNISHLMYESNGVVSFPHQIHRDYLSAVWMTKTPKVLDCWNERFITTTISDHIRILSGDGYWSGLAREILDYSRNRDDCRNLIINVINTFPYNEHTGVPDFSDIDLRDIRIPDYAFVGEKIKLAGAKINEFSIGCDAGEIVLLRGMAFSQNNEFLAGVSDGEVYIYSMDTGLKVLRNTVYPDRRQVGKAVVRFSSDSRYLFIRKTQDLIVFEKVPYGWRRVGVIPEVYVKKLHNAIIHDGVVSFYYTNRIKSYSLVDASQVENLETYHPYENIADGEDIAKIEPSAYPKDEEEFSVAISSEYRAVCYQDGRLIVYYKGGKILHNLENGKGVLRTAAISKDGNRAVTLSANTYNGKKRIQLWDLDERKKVSERFCSANTEAVYLTDHGDWIIGYDGTRYWIWNWDDQEQLFSRPERFIGETEHGIATYGNCVLYQAGDGRLIELNLDNQSTRSLGTFQSIQYATTLSNGKIAIVGNSGKTVDFRSTTDNRELKLNREQAKIKYIHAFKMQPFIAVLTAGGMVSIYHVGNGRRTRKLNSSVGYRLVAFHPESNVFSFSDGNRRLETFRYFEWKAGGNPRGKWCEPRYPDFSVDGKIITIGFNTDQEEQIMIETNGKITYMKDRFCDFHSQTKVITNFSVSSYDFNGVVCDDEIRTQLIKNGAEI